VADLQPFHLAIPVVDLEKTHAFYTEVLGCGVGRRAERWIDFDFFGHQVSVHLVDEWERVDTNEVDGDAVPARHFGVVLEWQSWLILSERLQKLGINFLIEPKIRFEGEPGEQATMFFRDPSGNALEFKSFKRPEALFAT